LHFQERLETCKALTKSGNTTPAALIEGSQAGNAMFFPLEIAANSVIKLDIL
jgi:hypothetical protein